MYLGSCNTPNLIIMYIINVYHFVVTTVSFSNSSYNVNEDNGNLEVILILSKPLSTDVIVTVTDIQGTAVGK